MNRIYKICLLLAVLALIFAFGNFAWAQGKGYFLENTQTQKFFIFDNLYINGFLAVEDTLTTKTGLFGDVLVGNILNLDPAKSFNFCKDTREAGSNAPLNKDCADKVLIWNPTSLDVVNNDFYEMQVNNISVAGNLELKSLVSTATINTQSPVSLTGCFTNATGAGNDTCNTGEFKTNKLYLNSFSNLNFCQGGTNAGTVCNGPGDCNSNVCNLNEVILSPSNLIFNNINLGLDDTNLGNQNLCTKVSPTTSSCPAGSGTAKSLTYLGGFKICCNLAITF